MITFISAAAVEVMMTLFFCEQKADRFHDDAIVYSLIGSTQNRPKLHSVNRGIFIFH